MQAYQVAIIWAGLLLEVGLLAGLLASGRARACLSFTIYAVAVTIPTLLFAAWPGRFYTWDNYMLKEIVHTLLKFAIAIELGYRTFRAFPTARLTGQRAIFLAFLLTAVVVLGVGSSGSAADRQLEWHARVLNGTIWLFAVIAGVVVWYRLPVHPFHKAILTGFLPYLLVFAVAQRAFADNGEAVRWLHFVHTLAYLLLLTYWTREAWSRNRPRVARRQRPVSQAA